MLEERDSTTGTGERSENRGQVLALLPLALLEAVREHDRPLEILEDEDLATSLPRRLGLTGVVSSQIQRYEHAAGSGGRVPAVEVTGLMQLVLRRPDAESIVRETGRRITRLRIAKDVPTSARMLRRWDRLVFIPMRRAARKLLRGLTGDVAATVMRPLVVRMSHAPLAAAGLHSCGVYTGALDELVRLYSSHEHTVTHVKCTARGDSHCEWAVE
jgi:hypothetical protein